MSSEELHAEILSTRQQITAHVQRLFELTTILARQARRNREGGRLDIAYANAWLRFSGAIQRGMVRAASSDRILVRQRQEREAQERVERERAAQEQRDQEAQEIRSRRPSLQYGGTTVANATEDFQAVYGEVIDA